MQEFGAGRRGQFEVFGRTPVEDEKDDDNVRDQEGADDEETVVGRFWKEDDLSNFWGNLA